MNGIQSRKALTAEKPFPGCLGRMVNLFDLSPGIAGNRMLMDRPHQDGSSLARSQSDVSRTSSPFGDKIEDKLIVSELRRTASSNKKSNGTPMKMLLDQEMSKEIDSRNEPPNVVAKLMGLEELPRHQPHSLQRSHTNGYSRSGLSHPSTPLGSWQQEFEARPERPNEYKDVYEVWQQKQQLPPPPPPPQKERNANDSKKMALIRQKFMEAKRLATDEKLRQSKEFHDALEVLSSDRDLFLKFLQEPNSLFSPNLYESQSVPPSSETKRITVLKPSKIVESEKNLESHPKSDNNINNNKQVKSPAQAERSPVFSILKADEYPTQPTRIVVLKPSTGKTHDIRAVASSPTSSPRLLRPENLEDDEAHESREVAKQITRQVRDNLMGHRRDETLLSSVFSNGYTGDESSFNKSENGYRAENLSDSEVMSPPSSRHSWDYINRLGSPFSSSSFSRASCSPESSVCREAKKRLSERWAMVASNGISQEQRHVRRSSSTLGEMLALSDVVKKSAKSDDEIREEPPELSELSKEAVIDSPRSLLRSKSVPGLSTVYDGSDSGKTDVPKELSKAKSSKLSLRGKVSSLFFSMSKKSSKEKLGSSESQSCSEGQRSLVPPGNAVSQSGNAGEREECLPPQTVGLKQGIVPREAGLSLAKPMMPGIAIENQDQPSPISVLEPPFEEDDNIIRESSGHLRPNPLGGQLLRSNLLDKSPPIGSIARTLSWDESYLPETATSTPFQFRPSPVPTLPEEDREYWLGFVRSLLSAAGLKSDTRCDSLSSSFPRWQSPEAPLDGSSRDKYAEMEDDDDDKGEPMMMMAVLHEAKRQRLRSVKKLVFDRVNSILADITTTTTGSVGPVLVEDRVWDRMKEWFSGGEARCVWEECGDPNSLVVDGVVRRELVGNGWAELLESEIGNLGKEIERKLLEELMEEAVVDFTDKI